MAYLARLLTLTSLLVLAAVAVPAAHGAGLRSVKCYIQNPTSGTLKFTYKAGGNDWQSYAIKSGFTQTFVGYEPHYIRYNNGQKYTQQYKLVSWSTNYFEWVNRKLWLRKR